ncbi:DeoR/GlpR family DNA-binding transcription regulator [Devosia rhodophyticola]|uniref:DeoR/GlpR family DNA-binding transcription regulator n=1 Tax=Devosia rhodophyticola TaxID=3026423 RepID=A0ABY7YZM6_9HYPH|nr:DeoR/GlpR family DNA-binding transcription regulator [Devosia rhodophyticola]WDR06845.1 DeoR/GlpR family DNA-binding transcription regulator [Devosia rhodophyticola]
MSGRIAPGSPPASDTALRATGRAGDRRHAILEAVRANGAASVAELAIRFGVTHQTIRRDLRTLETQGMLQKGFGGAFASPGVAHHTRDQRHAIRVAAKRQLVAALEEFLMPGATIFVGLGTTFDSLHEVLGRRPGVLIATPNLEVAHSCALKTDATVYVYGGYVRNKDSSVLTLADDSRQRFKFDIAVIGASAIDRDGTVQEFDPMEVDLVRSILPHSRQVILVAHDEKFGCHAPHVVTQLSQIDVLITNGAAEGRFDDPSLLTKLRVISTS